MLSPIDELKIQAKKHHRQQQSTTPDFTLNNGKNTQLKVQQKGATSDFPLNNGKNTQLKVQQQSTTPDFTLNNGKKPRLKDSQLLIARKYGFRNWDHAREVLDGNFCQDYGTFWYKNQCSTLLNKWCANYKQASQVQVDSGGFILPYKHQFLVVETHYLALLGLDSKDPVWTEINFDWCSGNIVKRQQLALQRIQNW